MVVDFLIFVIGVAVGATIEHFLPKQVASVVSDVKTEAVAVEKKV